MTNHTNTDKAAALAALVTGQLPEDAGVWIESNILSLDEAGAAAGFQRLFSRVPPFAPGGDLTVTAELKYTFDLQQFCRLLLMLKLPLERNADILNMTFEMADIKEQVILYRGLYFLDNAGDFVPRVTEGLRTNITAVFDAIALFNPYPARYLTEPAWNQMVLKAIFMGRPLADIYGLPERKNQKLALILHDYIRERWSAGRTITAEIWQLMPGFVNDAIRANLQKAAASADDAERIAATAALAAEHIN